MLNTQLSDLGYAANTVEIHLRPLGALDGWLVEERIGPDELTEPVLAVPSAARGDRHCTSFVGRVMSSSRHAPGSENGKSSERAESAPYSCSAPRTMPRWTPQTTSG